MQCPKCRFDQNDENTECPRCGIIFAKYRPRPPAPGTPRQRGVLRTLLFEVETADTTMAFGGRGLILLTLAVLSWMFAVSSFSGNDNPVGVMHYVNLPFHEAGHILFRPLGSFMASLGGSLGQLLMPLVCVAAFLLYKRDAFAASVCFWWFGESVIDLAPYIGDARSLTLPLLGGNTGADAPYGFHDWEYILTELRWLYHADMLAAAARVTGLLLMGFSVVWGGYVLFLIYRHRKG